MCDSVQKPNSHCNVIVYSQYKHTAASVLGYWVNRLVRKRGCPAILPSGFYHQSDQPLDNRADGSDGFSLAGHIHKYNMNT